jgi:MFS superfamily sulfate permease-like transporter
MQISEYISEIISGFTISLLLIPESIAFSFILGLPASAGIHSTMIMSFITSIFGGCPGLHRPERKMRQNVVMIYIFYNYVSSNLTNVPLLFSSLKY